MAIKPLERNRYFYGKMMDVAEFQKEQDYFRRQIGLLNRLTVGSGVVCGLTVIADPDVAGNVIVEAGVAIDGAGRLVIVPEPVSINPAVLSTGDPVDQGETILCLSYAEFCADPVPALVTDCDTPGECANATTREGFRLLVLAAAGPPAAPAGCVFQFPYGSPEELQKVLADFVSGVCPEEPAESCVPLARVTIPGLGIDAISDRKIVFTNLLLRQMNICLGLS